MAQRERHLIGRSWLFHQQQLTSAVGKLVARSRKKKEERKRRACTLLLLLMMVTLASTCFSASALLHSSKTCCRDEVSSPVNGGLYCLTDNMPATSREHGRLTYLCQSTSPTLLGSSAIDSLSLGDYGAGSSRCAKEGLANLTLD